MSSSYGVDDNSQDIQINPDKILKQALAEKEELLLRYPKLQQLQSDIDKNLEDKENPEERLTVILRMIKTKFAERKKLRLFNKSKS